jgi:hypothetical protein
MRDTKFGSHDRLCTIVAVTSLLTILVTTAYTQQQSRASHFSNITTISSTIPNNGDVNPYGVFRISRTVGKLTRGNILVSNFNNTANLQGTGTTLVQISPTGSFSLFAQIDANTLPGACPGGVGLTTALVVLRSGWVVVGSLPTSDGTANTAQAGCLIVLDSNGKVVETLTDPQINGPWDMTVFDDTGAMGTSKRAVLFVTNVLNGTVAAGGNIVGEGTVLRIVLDVSPSGAMPTMESLTVIGSMFPERTDPAALVIGPTGLALSKNDKTLYVADSLDNRVAAISDPLHRMTSADTGTTLSSGGHLNDPLGMTLATNGDILTANGGDGFLVETTQKGQQVSAILLDSSGTPPGAGALFGLTDVPGLGVVFVDDATNTLNVLSSRGQ